MSRGVLGKVLRMSIHFLSMKKEFAFTETSCSSLDLLRTNSWRVSWASRRRCFRVCNVSPIVKTSLTSLKKEGTSYPNAFKTSPFHHLLWMVHELDSFPQYLQDLNFNKIIKMNWTSEGKKCLPCQMCLCSTLWTRLTSCYHCPFNVKLGSHTLI